MSKTDAWHYYQLTVKKSIKYPLVATTISEAQCSHVEYTTLITALKSSGLPSNLQRDVIAALISHLGLNNSKLYVSQGKYHIYTLTNFGKYDEISGIHIKDYIE